MLDAAIRQKVLLIDYESREKRSQREIQPIGIYTRNGLWYCPAYCFQSDDIRIFRCDRIHSAAAAPSGTKPRDLRDIHLENRETVSQGSGEYVRLFAELTEEGVQTCEAEPWPVPKLHIRQDGTGWLEGNIAKRDIPFFAKFFIGLGNEATVKDSPELVDGIKRKLFELTVKYL